VSDLLQEGIRSKKSAIERHHLFPKSWLIKKGISEIRDINQIANYALVEWNDNVKIADRAPSEYLPNYLNRFSDNRDKMIYWHALPKNWENMNYSEFLIERRKLMALVIKNAFEKIQK
jgi:hypothetical protein